MIESIKFTNFKVLRDATLPLGPFTLLVGPNGSGKSTALEGFQVVRSGGKPYPVVLSAGVIPNAKNAVRVTICWAKPYHEFHAQATWSAPKNFGVKWYPRSEDVLSRELTRIRIYSINPRNLCKAVLLSPNMELAEDGENLAGLLDRLRDQAPERFEALNKELNRLLPEFDRILFETPQQGQRTFLLRTSNGHYPIRAEELSQGTLLAVAFLTLAYLPDPPPLLGLEEPDRGIHPRLLRQLRDALYRLAYPKDFGEDRPPVQVIATTQSPYFLDLFSDHPEEIVIAEKVGLEATFKGVMDHPHMDKILDGSAPLGEIWYSGILGGVPSGS